MAAIVSTNATNRAAGPMPTCAQLPLTINSNGASYATASGGLAFDLATLLNASAPPEERYINPSDIIFILGFTADGYCAEQFVLGTPTYNTTTDVTVQDNKISLATCPCTVRLFNGTTELSDGAFTKTITGLLFVQRGGRA